MKSKDFTIMIKVALPCRLGSVWTRIAMRCHLGTAQYECAVVYKLQQALCQLIIKRIMSVWQTRVLLFGTLSGQRSATQSGQTGLLESGQTTEDSWGLSSQPSRSATQSGDSWGLSSQPSRSATQSKQLKTPGPFPASLGQMAKDCLAVRPRPALQLRGLDTPPFNCMATLGGQTVEGVEGVGGGHHAPPPPPPQPTQLFGHPEWPRN